MRAALRLLAVLPLTGLLLIVGCGEGRDPAAEGAAPPSTPRLRLVANSDATPTILLSRAEFLDTTDPKTGLPVPKPARLYILREKAGVWQSEVVEDPDSNVFHKATPFPDPPNPGEPPAILTIGANAAMLKLWRSTGSGWTPETLWQAEFGGKQNRLRDFEVGDVTGGGQPNIVIVTHDQGVVAVLSRSEGRWQATEIDRKPKTFVHECELGDLDGDGLLEIYATPSSPNKLDGTPQPGEIVTYRHTADGFQRQVVEQFALRHVKEILATDIDGDGRQELLASVEAELAPRADAPPDANVIQVKRYDYRDGQYVGQVVCTLNDDMCRFFNAGDVDGDGKPELIASLHKRGLWLARPAEGQWKTEQIEADSGGFEHATALADLDGDGVQAIYVAADDQGAICSYRWADGQWKREVLFKLEKGGFTFNIYAGRL